MLTIDWQDLATWTIIAAAIAYLATRIRATARRRASSCGSACHGCETKPSTHEGKPLVTLTASTESRNNKYRSGVA